MSPTDPARYKIEQLRPGTYTVTFTLTGFSTVKRESLELSGSFAATVNAELRVGAVEETITVSAESPLVDVQSAARQRVISSEELTDIPTGRTQFTAATLIPGMNLSNQDVGGTNIINTTGGAITAHGSNGNDQRVMIDGLSTANAELAGNASNFLPNFGSVQEVAVDYSSGTAEQAYGGVRINMIPRQGGNTLKGSFFATAVNSSFQGNNYTQDLANRGLKTPNSINAESDVNPGLGGPLEKDKLWFYVSARWVHTSNFVGGIFDNLNAGDPKNFAYRIDPTNQSQGNRGINNSTQRSYNARLTWQASARNKFSVFVDDQGRCQCANVNSTTSPEAANDLLYPIERMATIAWTAPVSNRLLLEARGGFRGEHYEYSPTKTDPNLDLDPGDGTGRSGPRHPLSRHRAADQHPAVPEHLRAQLRHVGHAVVRHRLARVQSGRERHDHPARRIAWRRQRPRQLRVQQPEHEPDGAQPGAGSGADDAVSQIAAPAGRHRSVRAGQVDAQAADPQPGRALRLPRRLRPGASPRSCAAGAGAQHRPARDAAGELEGHHAANGCGLRCVRQRQDGLSHQPEQVCDRAGRARGVPETKSRRSTGSPTW